MAIVNLTPDSFSGDGISNIKKDDFLFYIENLINEGADILDLGAESSRPGSLEISSEEESRRLLPYLKLIKENFGIPVSIDTWRASTAKECLELKADWINDIKGLTDPDLALLVAKYNCKIVIMHNSSHLAKVNKNERLGNSFSQSIHKDVVSETFDFLKKQIKYAKKTGIKEENIIIDPGLGFGKTPEENLGIIRKPQSL